MAVAHVPVLLEPTLAALFGSDLQPPRVWLDGTFGRGGHAAAILAAMDAQDRLLVIDRDPQALAVAEQLAASDDRLTVLRGEWSDALAHLAEQNVARLAGVVLDLGVSSPQLDDAARGFSFRGEGPLDMRMDPTSGEPAADWLNHADVEEIAKVLWEYGEERYSRRIARAIVAARPLTTTDDLAQVVTRTVPAARRQEGKHDATRTFQAVRIHINDELGTLQRVLPTLFDLLQPGGRLCVISFHSLEDRLVKRYFASQSKVAPLPRRLPVRDDQRRAPARVVEKGRVPSERELSDNPRSRSARLRVLERVAEQAA